MGGDGGTRLLLPPSPRTHALSWAAHNSVAAGFLSLPPLLGPQRLSNLIFPAGEAALGASVAVPPPRPAGAAAGRCQVPKRTGKNRRKGNNNRKAEKKKREKKKAKVCRHTNEAKTRGKKPHNVESPLGGVSQCCEVGPSMGTERGSPGRAGGRGCPSPRLCPACSRRAGGQRRAASCAHRPPGPPLRVPPADRGRVTSTAERQQQHLSSSLLLLLAARPPACPCCLPPLPTPAPLPRPPTPPPHVRDGSPDHFRTDPRFQREREEERRWLKGRGERKVRPRRL